MPETLLAWRFLGVRRHASTNNNKKDSDLFGTTSLISSFDHIIFEEKLLSYSQLKNSYVMMLFHG